MARGRLDAVGIAVGGREVAVVWRRGEEARSVRVALAEPAPRSTKPDLAADLTRALSRAKAEVERAVGTATDGAVASVALLPPMVDVRVVHLPPMKAGEAELLLQRNAARYFVGPSGPRVIAVLPGGGNGGKPRGGEQGGVPWVAGAVPVSVLDAVHAAVATVGWEVGRVSVAHAGWLAASREPEGGGVQAVVAVADGTAHLMMLDGGHPAILRQLPSDDRESLRATLGTGPARALVLGPAGDLDGVRENLRARGWVLVEDPAGWKGALESAAARAGELGFELVHPRLLEARRARARRLAWRWAAAAAVLLLAAAGLRLWGLHRELSALQAERAALRDEVRPLLALRDSATALKGQVEALEEIARSAPVWSRTLVELSAALPLDSYLTGFYASGDTVEIEAASERAGEAIQALREAGLFAEVRLEGPVERELREGETAVERFRLWALLPGRAEGSEGR